MGCNEERIFFQRFRILKYEGMDDNKTPIFSMYKINGEYPTETYSYNRIYTECWKMQVGIRYIFN